MSARRVSTLLGAAAVTVALVALSGCASAGSGGSGTITYEVDGQQRSASFAPSNVECFGGGARGLSFPDKPYNRVALRDGSTDKVTAWVFGDELVYFEGDDDVTVTENTSDHGVVEYVVSAAAGRVAVTQLGQASGDAPPDVHAAIEDAEWFTGTIDLRVRCDA